MRHAKIAIPHTTKKAFLKVLPPSEVIFSSVEIQENWQRSQTTVLFLEIKLISETKIFLFIT